jgi:hypothetical protein
VDDEGRRTEKGGGQMQISYEDVELRLVRLSQGQGRVFDVGLSPMGVA